MGSSIFPVSFNIFVFLTATRSHRHIVSASHLHIYILHLHLLHHLLIIIWLVVLCHVRLREKKKLQFLHESSFKKLFFPREIYISFCLQKQHNVLVMSESVLPVPGEAFKKFCTSKILNRRYEFRPGVCIRSHSHSSRRYGIDCSTIQQVCKGWSKSTPDIDIIVTKISGNLFFIKHICEMRNCLPTLLTSSLYICILFHSY